MNEKDFRQDARKGIQKLIAEGLYGTEECAFVHWAFTEIFGLDADETEEACAIAGKNDKGIDAYYRDSEERIFYVIQGKYSRRRTRLGPDVVRPLPISINWLADPPEHVRQEVKDASQEYKDAVKEDYEVRLRLLTTNEATDETGREREQIEKFLPAHHYLEIFDVNKLIEEYENILSRRHIKPPNVTIQLDPAESFEDDQKSAIVATVRARRIAEIVREHRTAVVQQNVRQFLGRSNPVNKEIERTLRDTADRANFWLYNVGMTAVCDSYDPVADDGAINIRGFQIVNGCQTAWVLYQNEPQLDDNVKVLLRIIRTDVFEQSARQQLLDLITTRTNRQTATKGRDLLSNLPVQTRLQNEFDNLTPPWFLEVKAGELKTMQSQRRNRRRYGNRVIRNDIAAQALLSYRGLPAEAKSQKARIFDQSDSGFFGKVFNEQTRAEELLLSFILYQKIKNEESSFKKRFRAASRTDFTEMNREEREDLLEYEFLLHASNHLLAAMGILVARKYPSENPSKVLEVLSPEDVLGRFYDRVKDELKLTVLRTKQAEERQGKTFSYHYYFKSSETLESIRPELEFSIDHHQLLDILPNI